MDFLFNSNTVPIKIANILRGLIGELHDPGCSHLQVIEIKKSRAIQVPPTETQSNLLHGPNEAGFTADNSIDLAATYLKQYGEKAARSDDTIVPVELWNGVLFKRHFSHITYSPVKHGRALEVLRNKFALHIY